jgi:hypothetical protein
MKRLFIGVVTTACVAQLAGNFPALAATISLDANMEAASAALEQSQFKKAELLLKKALDAAILANNQDVAVARAEVMYARALREGGKYVQAGAALEQAHTIFKVVGHVEPAYVDELKSLSNNYQRLDLNVLGDAAAALKEEGVSISLCKDGTGGHVQIDMNNTYQNSLNNPKVDGVQLEKSIVFDIERPDSSSVHVRNIKGFRIHSVEKNTWVNLLDLAVGGQADSDGKLDATITAGKAGITKTVPSKLPTKAFDIVSTIANRLSQFGTPAELDLPVVAVKAKEPDTAVSGSGQSAAGSDSAGAVPAAVNGTSSAVSTTESGSPKDDKNSAASPAPAVPVPAETSAVAPSPQAVMTDPTNSPPSSLVVDEHPTVTIKKKPTPAETLTEADLKPGASSAAIPSTVSNPALKDAGNSPADVGETPAKLQPSDKIESHDSSASQSQTSGRSSDRTSDASSKNSAEKADGRSSQKTDKDDREDDDDDKTEKKDVDTNSSDKKAAQRSRRAQRESNHSHDHDDDDDDPDNKKD